MPPHTPFLGFQRQFESFLEQIFVAIEQGLMSCGSGINFFERGVVVTPGGDVAKPGDVGETPEITGDNSEPLRDEFLDNGADSARSVRGIPRGTPIGQLQGMLRSGGGISAF
jgi:hypothetical protein